MNKQKLLEQILSELTEKYESLCLAARATYDGATHEDSKAEGKYDTRSLEASYLAGAQAKRVSEVEESISRYESMKIREFSFDDPVALGALVKLESDSKSSFYFIGPDAGGMNLQLEGEMVTVITPKSPLGQSLIGKKIDDEVEVRSGNSKRFFNIIEIF